MSKKFAELTTPERWEWHARVYAFRRVVLGISPDVRTSPPDPNGEWFDPAMVEREERALRNKHAARQREIEKDREERRKEDDAASAKREAMAAELGYPSFGYMLCIGLVNAVKSAYAHGRGAGKVPTAADLGVTAREYTPEEMAKARAELVDHGMPPDPEDELLPPGLDANGKPTGSGEAPFRPEAA